jgi:TPP-dependent indolepyruvate ferredoxin oxidoreductase alpha subunit
MKEFLSGNEAVARGVYEAGVALAAAYPGTPSTEILETIAARYPSVYSQWSPNEKVAFEVGIGASIGCTLCTQVCREEAIILKSHFASVLSESYVA